MRIYQTMVILFVILVIMATCTAIEQPATPKNVKPGYADPKWNIKIPAFQKPNFNYLKNLGVSRFTTIGKVSI